LPAASSENDVPNCTNYIETAP